VKRINRYIFIALVSSVIVGCGSPRETMSAESRTLSDCLSSIKKSSGLTLQIVTDEPDMVSGILSNGEGFGCEKKSSGTKGTYYRTWYMVKKK